MIKRANDVEKPEGNLRYGRTACTGNKEIGPCVLRNPWATELHLLTRDVMAL